jgi:hypothetical protein
MIWRKTVFVLGAGASYPYGFPTGEGLVNDIVALASEEQTRDAFLYNDCVDRDVLQFAKDLADSDTPSVDSFLEHRPDFLKIGKLAICLSLIPKERDDSLSRDYRQGTSIRGRMAWYQYLWNEMASPKGEFGKNQISFVTLNYDRSLERYFFLRLKAQHQYADNEECFKELYQLSFVHVYGSLGDDRFIEDPFNRREPSVHEVRRSADRLRIIHEETTEAQYLSEAVALLHEAEVICFLGYGFHGLNNQRLTLTKMPLGGRFKKWFATRYGMTDVEFRRRTSQFYARFAKDEFGQVVNHIGAQNDGALEVLRNMPIIE